MTSRRREGIALDVLSGGAAQGIVGAIDEEFRLATGAIVRGTFGAVGAMRERLAAGRAVRRDHPDGAAHRRARSAGTRAAGHRRRRSAACARASPCATASRMPAIADGAALRATLLAAAGIYFPDPVLATAGIHFVKVLRELGIQRRRRRRGCIRFRTARPRCASSRARRRRANSGCTQITEIKSTPGVVARRPASRRLRALDDLHGGSVHERARARSRAALRGAAVRPRDARAARGRRIRVIAGPFRAPDDPTDGGPRRAAA